MDLDLMEVSYKFLILFIYGSTVIITMVFILSVKLYLCLDEALNLNFFVTKIISPAGIYSNVLSIDSWFVAHNRIVGFFLLALSTWDLIMLYNVKIIGLF